MDNIEIVSILHKLEERVPPIKDALPNARKYDFDPNIIDHLQELRNRLP